MKDFSFSTEFLRSIVSYDPITGLFTWRNRPSTTFKAGKRQSAELTAAKWNGRYAGKVAGSPDGHGYIQIPISGIRRPAHRLAWFYMTGEQPPEYIDHKNTIKSANWWDNLRAATVSENNKNCGLRKTNRSGFKGVCFDVGKGMWAARIQADNRTYRLGRYSTPEMAHAAYCEASKRLHGDFGRT